MFILSILELGDSKAEEKREWKRGKGDTIKDKMVQTHQTYS